MTIKIRCYRHFDPEVFSKDVENMDWTPVTRESDLDRAAQAFNDLFTKLINKHMPWKKLRVRANNAPWINNEFMSLIDAREFHSIKYKQCPCDYHFAKCKDSRTLVQRMKNQLKRE